MKQIEVQIMGQSYLLGCPEGGEARLRDAVEKVDEQMCRIRDAGKVKARERIAVLAALNLAFESGERAIQSAAQTAALNAAQAAAQATAPSSIPTTSPAPAASAEDPRVGQLVGRIDRLLGDDGRLF
jgi:cell division protein ZapA